MMAARGLLSLYRDVAPELLRTRDRGKDATMNLRAGEFKKRQSAAMLLAAGVARSIGEFDWANELLVEAESLCTGSLRPAWENEQAALMWHRGDCTAALAAWDAMPETPTVLFNRGMANLFLGNLTVARELLGRAVAVIPEASGWHALARLYQTVGEIHG